jgi:hypothetical protein
LKQERISEFLRAPRALLAKKYSACARTITMRGRFPLDKIAQVLRKIEAREEDFSERIPRCERPYETRKKKIVEKKACFFLQCLLSKHRVSGTLTVEDAIPGGESETPDALIAPYLQADRAIRSRAERTHVSRPERLERSRRTAPA